MHRIVIRLEALGGQFNPMDKLSVQPSNWCTVEPTVPTTKKRKSTIPASMSLCLEIRVECAVKSWNVLEQSWKKGGCRSCHLLQGQVVQKRWLPRLRPMVEPVDDDWVRPETWPTVSLQRITQLKCVNSAIRSKGQKSYLERYSRRGSRHLVEPTWVNTLAQNCHVEFWCGMHLTCKNTKN